MIGVRFNAKYITNINYKMENLLLALLSPTRRNHSSGDLGPNNFEVDQVVVNRCEHEINGVPFSSYVSSTSRPTIVYVHSYNSNRLEVKSILKPLLKYFNVVAIELQRVKYNESINMIEIDREQGYISFGFYESEQIRVVVDWVKREINEKVYIWGRSMGAVSSLLYEHKYKDVEGLILDSPFHSLKDLLIGQFTNITNLPNLIGKTVLFFGKSYLESYLRYDIEEMNVAQKIDIHCPVFIIVNPNDPFAGASGQIIYSKCRNIRKLYYSEAEHSASREQYILSEIIAQLNHFQKRRRYVIHRPDSNQKDFAEQYRKKARGKTVQKKRTYLSLASSKNQFNFLCDRC